MKTRIFTTSILFFFLLQSSTLVQAQNLFRYLDRGTTAFTERQSNILTAIQNRPTSVEVYLIQIDNLSSLLTRQSISVNFPASLMDATLKHFVQTENDIFTWTGNFADQQGSVLLTATGTDVTGMIHFQDMVFGIEPLGKELHALIHLDQSKFGPDEPPDAYSGKTKNNDTASTEMLSISPDSLQEIQKTGVSAQTNPVIDILVVFTPAAAASGNINSLINACISTTNDICSNSNADASVNKVNSQQVNYTESGNLETDVDERLSVFTLSPEFCILLGGVMMQS